MASKPAEPLYRRFLKDEPYFFRQAIEDIDIDSVHGRFDVVLACDVIEHVERPDLFLEKVAEVLKPGGLLCVSTPDVGSLLARVSGRSWHYYNRYHLSYLTRSTIRAVAETKGFTELGFARLPRLKSVGYLLLYLTDFIMGRGRLRLPARLTNLMVPINLYDTMYVAFEKRLGSK